MPVKNCVINGNPGLKWGDAGKCYGYKKGNKMSEAMARKKAIAQGVAINEFSENKIGFDFDDVITTKKGQEIASKLLSEGKSIYIISARSTKNGILTLAEKLGIDKKKIFATGSNKAKIEKIKLLDLGKFYDNNPKVIEEIEKIGELFKS